MLDLIQIRDGDPYIATELLVKAINDLEARVLMLEMLHISQHEKNIPPKPTPPPNVLIKDSII